MRYSSAVDQETILKSGQICFKGFGQEASKNAPVNVMRKIVIDNNQWRRILIGRVDTGLPQKNGRVGQGGP